MKYETWNGQPPKKTCPGSLITSQWLSELLKRPDPSPPPKEACVYEKEVIEAQRKELESSWAIIRWATNLLKK